MGMCWRRGALIDRQRVVLRIRDMYGAPPIIEGNGLAVRTVIVSVVDLISPRAMEE